MHSRRDQVEAHSFVTNRMRSALLRAEPDAPHPPLRRTPLGLLAGLVAALLVVAVVAVLAILRPGSAAGWRQKGTLIVEKQTGTRYVLVADRLHPVANFASAKLLLGKDMTVAAATTKALKKLQRGGQVGIVGAPDAMPAAARAGRQPWLACAVSARTETGTSTPQTGLTIGTDPPAADSAAALVVAPEGTRYVVAGGVRLKVTADWAVRALGLDRLAPIPVRSGWLDLLPAGPDLGRLPLADRGDAGPTLDARPTRVGQIVLAAEPSRPARHYLVLRDGLAPVNDTAVALLLGDPKATASYPGASPGMLPVSQTALASAPSAETPAWAAELPDLPRAMPDPAGRVPCVRRTAGDGSGPTVVLLRPDAMAMAPVDVPGVQRDGRTADLVGIPAGGGLLARTEPVPGVTGSGLFLVTETGVKYPIAGADAAKALGYDPDAAVPAPESLLGLLPTGPLLRVLSGGGA